MEKIKKLKNNSETDKMFQIKEPKKGVSKWLTVKADEEIQLPIETFEKLKRQGLLQGLTVM